MYNSYTAVMIPVLWKPKNPDLTLNATLELARLRDKPG